MLNFLTKAYVLKSFAFDAATFIGERIHDMNLDFDTKRLLHRAGLERYRPRQQAFGAMGLFFLGTAVGGVLGLAFAVRTGAELRERVRQKAKSIIGAAQNAMPPGAQAKYDQPRM